MRRFVFVLANAFILKDLQEAKLIEETWLKANHIPKMHEAKTFLITCMDFRLLDNVTAFMNKQGYYRNYDHFILAGASLGATQSKYSSWKQTLVDHLSLGLQLHHCREVIFIDHMYCGAYHKFYPHTIGNHILEEKMHQKNIQLARDTLAKAFPNLQFKGYLMNLDGEVIPVEVNGDVKYKAAAPKHQQGTDHD